MQITPKSTSPVEKTKNLAGGEAHGLPLVERFVSRVTTCLYGEAQYYGDQSSELVADTERLLKEDPGFVLKAAVYARHVMNLRTVPVLLLGMYALRVPMSKEFEVAVSAVCTRPDQLQELMGFIASEDRKKLLGLHGLRRAVAAKLNSFDEYQFGKYISRSHAMKLRDLILISHPKPKDEAQSKLFKAVLDNRVPAPMTWETLYMQAKTDQEKASAWMTLLAENRLPYMAALRNLRNMCKVLATHELQRIAGFIADADRVRKSRQWPFRFLSASEALSELGTSNAGFMMEAVGIALERSVANVPALEGTTFMSADNSGSMRQAVSDKSQMSMNMVANLMQAILLKKTSQSSIGAETYSSVFGQDFKMVAVNPANSCIAQAQAFRDTNVGHSTNGYLVFRHIARAKIKVDRVVIFTDCQLWVDGGYNHFDQGLTRDSVKAARLINPNMWIHWIDLSGYGTLPQPIYDQKVNLISGWSERVLDYIGAVERGRIGMAKAIQEIDLS